MKQDDRFAAAPVLLTLAMLTPGLLLAQHRVELPVTPAGKELSKMLSLWESGEDAEEYVEKRFSPRMLEAYSVSQHVDFFRQVSQMHGGFWLEVVDQKSDYELAFLGRSRKRPDSWRRMTLKVEEESPHRVDSMTIDQAQPLRILGDAPTEGEGGDPSHRADEAGVLELAARELDQLSQDDEFSGAVLIAKDGKVLSRKAFGLASKRFSVPNNPETKFNLGSINKSFTKLAVAQLLEQEKLSLDDTIGEHLAGFPPEIADRVTVRQLITMSSGMSDYWNEDWNARWSTIKTVEDLLEIISKIPLDFEPGTQKQYSNSGYTVLGAIVAAVSGQSYYDYVREHIFEPAGMADTDSYEMDQIVPNLAIGYTANQAAEPYQGNRWQNNLFVHSVKGGPAGGGYSTLDDLLRYVEALKANRLGGPEVSNLAMSPDPDEPRRPKAFALAGGAPVGINAFLGADLEGGYTIVVLSNYDPPTAMEFGSKYLGMLRELE